MQVECTEQDRQKFKKEIAITTGRLVSEEKLDDKINGDEVFFTQNIITDKQVTTKMMSDIDDRYREILRVEKNVKAICDLFVDLNMMVECQGELFDNIEDNVRRTVDFVEEAEEEIVIAENEETQYRKRILIIILILVIVLIIAFILIFL